MRGMLRTLTEYDVCGLSQQSCLVLSDEAGEEEVDEEEEEDEEEEKEAMEKEPHLTSMLSQTLMCPRHFVLAKSPQ